MYKIYFKQAVRILRQNPFISIISILGTALAIMMIMTLIITERINIVDMSPEINRSRTMYIPTITTIKNDKTSTMSNSPSYEYIQEHFSNMKTPEMVSYVSDYSENPWHLVKPQGSNEYHNIVARSADANFWKIMQMKFIAGKPFDQHDVESRVPVAVITESAAKRLFKDEDPVGRIITVSGYGKNNDLRIIGVVKDVGHIFKEVYSDIWVPASIDGFTYMFTLMLIARDKKDFPAICEEVREIERKATLNDSEWEHIIPCPYTREEYTLDSSEMWIIRKNVEKELKVAKRKKWLMLTILIFIPAINLSGFSMSRMKKRMPEIGIRKAFGAKKHIILMQVLYENLITSLIGGAIGLLLSYLMIIRMKSWLLDIPMDSTIPIGSLISIPVIAMVIAICILINIISAAIPAYRAARMNIVNSIHQNDKQL